MSSWIIGRTDGAGNTVASFAGWTGLFEPRGSSSDWAWRWGWDQQKHLCHDEAMLYELRQYQATPGNRAALVRMMEEEVIPFQISKGMVILASFEGEDNPDTYVWMRRFKDEEERRDLYRAVYKSDEWTNDLSVRIAPLLIEEAIKVTRLTPTPKSPLQ
jgi:NIPSNAP